MPHNLTDADAFTSPVAVPDGTDSRNNAANVVEALAQVLANRTNYLNLRTAKLAAANTFTAAPQTIDVNAADVPAIRVTKTAHDHPSFGTNKWKVVGSWQLSDARWVRLFSGEGTDSAWAITLNAKWDPSSSQAWEKDFTASESNMLRCVYGELHWYGRGVGVGTWTDAQWDDQARGNVLIGDTLSAKTVQASDDVKAADQFLYVTPRVVQVELSPEDGYHTSLSHKSLGNNQTAWFQIRVPQGVALGTVRIKANEATTAVIDYELYRTHGIDHSTAGLPTHTIVDSLHVSPPGAGGVFNRTLSFGGLNVDNTDERYWIRIYNDTAGAGDVDVYAVQLEWTDNGPRND